MYHASASNLDDLLRAVLTRLLSNHRDNNRVTGSRKGPNWEVFGALLELKNPRARLSRTEIKGRVFSALGELLWYLAADNSIEFIEHYLRYREYSDDGGQTASGAYGPRIFGGGEGSQYSRIIEKLKDKPDTRNAVIQVFSENDVKRPSNDVPCTCTLQFAVRKSRLLLNVSMRSNDAFLGLPHDIFAFTMIQEIAACQLGVEPGTYTHAVGSLHLYDHDREKAERFVREGHFEPVPMPKMPSGDPWPAIQEVLLAEKTIRAQSHTYSIPENLDPYWADLIRLLQIHKGVREGASIRNIISVYGEAMDSDVYELYVRDRLRRRQNHQAQQALDLG